MGRGEILKPGKPYFIKAGHRVNLFVNGEWKEITVDDYIPCKPGGYPIYKPWIIKVGSVVDLWIPSTLQKGW